MNCLDVCLREVGMPGVPGLLTLGGISEHWPRGLFLGGDETHSENNRKTFIFLSSFLRASQASKNEE